MRRSGSAHQLGRRSLTQSGSAAALRYAERAVRGDLVDAVTRRLPVLERLYLDELMKTHDANEGIRAFMAKEKPSYQDR